MTLGELVREQTRTVRDLLESSAREMEELKTRRATALAQIQRTRREIGTLKELEVECAATMRPLESMVADLERAINDLQSQIERLRDRAIEFKAALKETRETHEEVEGQLAAERKAERRDQQHAEELAHELAKVGQGRAQQRARLGDEQRKAFATYLDRIWRRLCDLSRQEEELRGGREALKELERQRHDDPHIAVLWEARQEWAYIEQSTAPALVRNTARSKVAEIEEELNTRFPNALAAAQRGGPSSELEELYFVSGDGGAVWVPLPLPVGVWSSCESRAPDFEHDLVARIVWALARVFPPSQYASRFVNVQGLRGLAARCSAETLQEADGLRIELPAGGTVAFLFSPLPGELAEVIQYADTDG